VLCTRAAGLVPFAEDVHADVDIPAFAIFNGWIRIFHDYSITPSVKIAGEVPRSAEILRKLAILVRQSEFLLARQCRRKPTWLKVQAC